MDRVQKVSEWPPNVLRQARDLQKHVLRGVGGTWEREELGDCAIHMRRRLSVTEMQLLHGINASCPVFTHGAALQEILRDPS